MGENFHLNHLLRFGSADGEFKVGLSVVSDNAPAAWKKYADTLTPGEYEQFCRQKTDNAKNSFCFGRLAAKAAANTVTENAGPDFTVSHGIFGFPLISPNPHGLCLSIAHTDHAGMALCFSEKLMMGADLEKIDGAHSSTMVSALGEREKQLRLPGMDEVLRHHVLWAVREALSKTLRTGFLIPLSLLEVRAMRQKQERYELDFVHFPLFTAVAFELKGYVLALVYPKKLTLNPDFLHCLRMNDV